MQEGREVQELARDNPECADQETAELMQFLQEESGCGGLLNQYRRGFFPAAGCGKTVMVSSGGTW